MKLENVLYWTISPGQHIIKSSDELSFIRSFLLHFFTEATSAKLLHFRLTNIYLLLSVTWPNPCTS